MKKFKLCFITAALLPLFSYAQSVETWKTVAGFGGPFTLTATTKIRMSNSAGTKFTEREMVAGEQWCTLGKFGFDPAPGESKVCQKLVSEVAPPSNKPPMGIGDAPYPAGDPGYTTGRTFDTAEQPGGPNDIGSFRNSCKPAFVAPRDPIVWEGQMVAGHPHVFFGAVLPNTAVYSVAALDNAPTTCQGGTALNRSVYWAPPMVDIRTSKVVMPNDTNNYYKDGYRGVDGAQIKTIPKGLRVIAGNSRATTPDDPDFTHEFKCFNTGYKVGDGKTWPITCGTNDDVLMVVNFPQCWDGVNLDSPDHKSHMAYASGSNRGGPGVAKGCPVTHPVALPELSMNIHYREKVAGESKYWRLSSDVYQGTPGYSAHGDVVWNWNQAMQEKLLNACNRVKRDCHNHLIGGGKGIY